MDERSTCETDDIRWDQFPDAAQWRSDKIIAQVETRTGTPPPTPYHFALLVMRDIYRALQPHVRYFEQSSLNPQFFEDAMNTGLRAIASGEGIIVPAEELGKYKMIFQMFALHGLLVHFSYLGIDFHLAGMYFLWISTVISLWSGGIYTARVVREIRAHGRESRFA